jgi:hypothetical protein
MKLTATQISAITTALADDGWHVTIHAPGNTAVAFLPFTNPDNTYLASLIELNISPARLTIQFFDRTTHAKHGTVLWVPVDTPLLNEYLAHAARVIRQTIKETSE